MSFRILLCLFVYIYPLFRLSAMDLRPEEIRGQVKQSPVSVLQSRYFTKSFRPELGVAMGSFVNQAYTDTSLYGVRGAWYFNEWFGIEVQSIKTKVSDSEDRQALNELRYRKVDSPDIVSPDPEVNSISAVDDFNVIFAPFYGKSNLLGNVIIYSDLYFTGGYSRVQTDQGELSAASWGVGQRFYWQKNISLRLDVRDRVYEETRNDQPYTKHSYSFDVGLSYFFF